MNPFGLFLGALGGLLFGNKMARQNLDPAEYTALRVKYLTKVQKMVAGIFAAMFLVLVFVPQTRVLGIFGVLGFVFVGWVWGPRRIVRREARRMEREQHRAQREADRMARGEFRPEDPEYWRR